MSKIEAAGSRCPDRGLLNEIANASDFNKCLSISSAYNKVVQPTFLLEIEATTEFNKHLNYKSFPKDFSRFNNSTRGSILLARHPPRL
jgi:hypothetical protein